MKNMLYPKLYYSKIGDIDFDMLKSKGIKGLVFDIDNTLSPYDVAYPDEQTVELFEELAAKGFELCLVSNNGRPRVQKFNERLNVFAVWKAKKPGTEGISRAMAQMGTDKNSSALIGDQVFTDVWCANSAGMTSILIKPKSERDEFSVRLKRIPEKLVLYFYFRKLRKARHHK